MKTKKSVVITGVSRGLGQAMTTEFIEQGWTVAGCCRTSEAIEKLRAQHSAPHFFMQADVSHEDEVAAFCAEILKRNGPPDLLLNNAGIANHNAPLWEISAEEFGAVIDVNIKGTVAMIRHLAPAMLKRGQGVIVNFSSGWGRSTSPEVAPYCTTKWAVEGLSQAMSQETNGKIAVVALNPGIIDTEMLRGCFGEAAGQYPKPAEWAKRAVPFLMKISAKDNGKPLTVG